VQAEAMQFGPQVSDIQLGRGYDNSTGEEETQIYEFNSWSEVNAAFNGDNTSNWLTEQMSSGVWQPWWSINPLSRVYASRSFGIGEDSARPSPIHVAHREPASVCVPPAASLQLNHPLSFILVSSPAASFDATCEVRASHADPADPSGGAITDVQRSRLVIVMLEATPIMTSFQVRYSIIQCWCA
jgi:hypothetical protein